jgi:succinate dehydrogenase hydrophobic anchor subunit
MWRDVSSARHQILSSKLFVGSKRQAFLVFLLSFWLLYIFGIRLCPDIAAVRYCFPFASPFVTIILSSRMSWEVSGRRLVVGYRRFGTRYRSLLIKHILPSTRLFIRMHERNSIKLHVQVFLRMNTWLFSKHVEDNIIEWNHLWKKKCAFCWFLLHKDIGPIFVGRPVQVFDRLAQTSSEDLNFTAGGNLKSRESNRHYRICFTAGTFRVFHSVVYTASFLFCKSEPPNRTQNFFTGCWWRVQYLLLLLLLLLLLTAIELSLVGSCPYTNTDKTNKNKYT